MNPISYLDALAGSDAALGWLVITLALSCCAAGWWLWLDSLTYARQRRLLKRTLWLRQLGLEADEARQRAGLPRIQRPVSVFNPSTPTDYLKWKNQLN